MAKAKPPVDFKILLDQVNRIRMALAIGEGKLEELPKGIIAESDQCVLARALSNGWQANVTAACIELTHSNINGAIDMEKVAVSLKTLGFKGAVTKYQGGVEFEPSLTMRNFIVRFDKGDFPWLILDSEGVRSNG